MTSTPAPATSRTNWAARIARGSGRVQAGQLSVSPWPSARLLPQAAASARTVITAAQCSGSCHGWPCQTATTSTGTRYVAVSTTLITVGPVGWSART